MRPKEKVKTRAPGLLEDRRLDLMLRADHERVRLAAAIDWDGLSESFVGLYAEKTGLPGIPFRTMAGLVLLQHTFGLSDEQVVRERPERPYWQCFSSYRTLSRAPAHYVCGAGASGEEFFSVFPAGIRETERNIQHELPVDFSQISRWRKRIGKEGVERIPQLTIEAGLRTRTITPKQMQVVVVDTTVQPKAVAHPTDARLYRKTLHHLLRVAEAVGIKLRQSYRELSESAFLMCGRYAKAKHFKRAARERKKLKVYARRVQRDLEWKLSDEAWERHKGTMILAELALTQAKKTKGKVYSMHAPEVECIAKGKAHKPYEFGVKTSLATTAWGGFALGAMALPGNPHDGHTLEGQLEQVHRLTGRMPKRCHVDRGYKGHGVDSVTCRVIIAGSRKGISKAIRQEMKRRSSIEPEIGHQKFDGKLGRNWLKGMLGDAQNAILCAAGHNLKKVLAHLRRLFVLVWAWLMAALRPLSRPLASEAGAA